MSTPRQIRLARRLAMHPMDPAVMDLDEDDQAGDECDMDAPWPAEADAHAADAAADRWQHARGL